MRRSSLCLAVGALLLSLSGECLAHRVNVFAFVDGDAIQVECGFSRSQKVRNGTLVVTDLETGAELLRGVTDELGRFRFRPPDAFLRSGHGLNIRLLAGEGHQDDWRMSAEELRALSRTEKAALPTNREESGSPRAATVSRPAESPRAAFPLDADQLEAIVGKVVEEKLAPVRQALARQQERDPDLRDIVGGLGWIMGLLGLATYFRYGRRERHG